MKTLLILFSMLIPFVADAQLKRIYPAKQIQKCYDENGDVVENCILVSDANGELQFTGIEDAAIIIETANASAVDSIWSSNDTLYVSYNNAPTLAYYAPGLNGIYGTANNNKPSAVSVIQYPITGSGQLLFQTAAGLAKVQFNANTNTPLTLTAQASEGRMIYGLPSTANQCFISTTGGGEIWKIGNNNGVFNITPRQFMFFPVVSIDEPTSTSSNPINQLRLHPDTIGTISMSGYTPARAFSSDPLNIAGWDVDGKLQKYSFADLADSINVYEAVEEQNTKIYQALGSEIQAVSYGEGVVDESMALTDNRARYSAIWLDAGITATGIKWLQHTQGSYTADQSNYVALYSYSGGTLTRVAISVNDGNIWKAATGAIGSAAFTTPYAVTVSGVYFIGILYNSSSQVTAPRIGNHGTNDVESAATLDFTNSAKLQSMVLVQPTLPSIAFMPATTTQFENPWLAIY